MFAVKVMGNVCRDLSGLRKTLSCRCPDLSELQFPPAGLGAACDPVHIQGSSGAARICACLFLFGRFYVLT